MIDIFEKLICQCKELGRMELVWDELLQLIAELEFDLEEREDWP